MTEEDKFEDLMGRAWAPPKKTVKERVTTVAGYIIAYTLVATVLAIVGIALYGAIKHLARWAFG